MKNAFHFLQTPMLLLVASALAGCNKESAVEQVAPEQKTSIAAGLEGTGGSRSASAFARQARKYPTR